MAGTALRLVWPGDIEFKGDEFFLFDRSQHVGAGDPWPSVGEGSSVGVPNPGMGIWIFAAIARVFGIHDPASLGRAAEILNVCALLVLVAFALRWVSQREREPWLWAAALVALSPSAILFSRKLWANSALPFFTMLAIAAWWQRGRRWGAAAWGLLGACLGQIQLSGFFFAGGFVLWTALFDRASVRWRWWLAGTAAGSVTLVAWAGHVLSHGSSPHRSFKTIAHLWFWRMWVGHPFAFDMRTSFGRQWNDFLAYPTVAGWHTHAVAAGYVVIVAVALATLYIAVRALWPRRRQWRELVVGRDSGTSFAVSAALWGFGGLLTLTGLYVYRHYLIVAFVLPFLFVAWLALLRPVAGRRLLAVLCVAQALLSVAYLAYVHHHKGVPGGDYGVTYAEQVKRNSGGH